MQQYYSKKGVVNASDYGHFEKSHFSLFHSVTWTTKNGTVQQVSNTYYALQKNGKGVIHK
jgi:hypothetical protein